MVLMWDAYSQKLMLKFYIGSHTHNEMSNLVGIMLTWHACSHAKINETWLTVKCCIGVDVRRYLTLNYWIDADVRHWLTVCNKMLNLCYRETLALMQRCLIHICKTLTHFKMWDAGSLDTVQCWWWCHCETLAHCKMLNWCLCEMLAYCKMLN